MINLFTGKMPPRRSTLERAAPGLKASPRATLLLLAIGLGVLQAPACAQDQHLNGALETTQLPVSPDVMNRRIEDAALKYLRYAPVARYAQYDYVAPRDAQEYAALHGYGVVLVSVLTQVPAEVPPKRLYAKVGSTIVPLALYSSGAIGTAPDSIVGRVFGSNRWEGLYLLPLYLVAGGAQLVMDFALNRDGFVLAQFGERERESSKHLPIAMPAAGAPPGAALANFLTREYPGFDGRREAQR